MRKGNARERERNSLIRSRFRSVMSSWRSSNVDEVVRAAFARKSLMPPKEEEYWRVLSVVNLVVIHCDLPMVGGAFRLGTVVGVAVDDDGVVPGCPGGGVP